jgi:ABC-2 type transport system permease protein
MSTASPQPFSDTMTMLWRNILHNLRAPSGVITVIGVPLIFLLLFVYVFGETLGAGLKTGGTRDEYLAYITPAILLMAAASATQMIAVWISMDMSHASNVPLLLMILPLLSGGFVPIESLPGRLQGIAEYQPFTPIISTIRGLLADSPEGRDAAWAVGWSIAIAVIGYVWSRWLYHRHTAPSLTRAAGVG